LHATGARRNRFATIKDRYSYRMGSAIPNESLGAERANHYEVGYADTLASKWQWQANLFRSDISDLIQSVSIARTVPIQTSV
jgi:iron complex outermembrane recepter protein